MGFEQIHPQRRPAHLRLSLGRSKVLRSGQVESALHRAEGLLDLEANAPDRCVEGLDLLAQLLSASTASTPGESASTISTSLLISGSLAGCTCTCST